jgi:hypothetical protein
VDSQPSPFSAFKSHSFVQNMLAVLEQKFSGIRNVDSRRQDGRGSYEEEV